MYLRPTLIEDETSFSSTRFLLYPKSTPDYRDLPSSVLRSGLLASHDLAAAPASRTFSEQNFHLTGYGEYGSVHPFFPGHECGDRQIYTRSRHVMGDSRLDANRHALENADSSCVVTGDNMLTRYGTAIDNPDILSAYSFGGIRTMALPSTFYSSESDVLMRLNQRFPDLTMARKHIFRQEMLNADARRAETEVGRLHGFGNLRRFDGLQRNTSLCDNSVGSITQPDVVYHQPLRNVATRGDPRNSKDGRLHGFGHLGRFEGLQRNTLVFDNDFGSITQPDTLSQQPLRNLATGEDTHSFNSLTRLASHGGYLEGFPQRSYCSRSCHTQILPSDLYAGRSSFLPKYPFDQHQSSAEHIPGKSFKRNRSPGEPRKGKKKAKREKEIRVSHSVQVFPALEEQPKLSSTVREIVSNAQSQKQYMAESQKSLPAGPSESRIDESDSKSIWNCDSNVKSYPDWNYVETDSELVMLKTKDTNALRDVQKIACVASRNFFQSLQGDDEDSDETADSVEEDDDNEYASNDNQEPRADSSARREAEAYKFFTQIFADDSELRKFYEENRNCGVFECLVCFAEGSGMKRRYPDLVSLTQHAKTIIKTKKRFEHRGYWRAVSDLLGWLSLDSKVISVAPRGCVPPLEADTTSKISLPPLKTDTTKSHSPAEVNDDCVAPA